MNFVKSLAKQLGPKGIRVCLRPALVNMAHSIHEKQIILLIRAGVYSRLRSAAQQWSPRYLSVVRLNRSQVLNPGKIKFRRRTE
jgi:hypothetical protein